MALTTPEQTKSKENGVVPLVSVGMPAYNAEPFIAAAIESVLGQSLTNLELIISDNASTDATFSICQRYAATDPRIRLERSAANVGAHPNYRKVADAARGTYFKWAAANDLVAPNYLESCVRTLETRPDAVLAFGSTVLFEHDPLQGAPYDDQMNIADEQPFLRFRRCLERMRLNNVLNGVMRLDTLRATSLMPNYMGADILVLAELALAGKFIEVPATRFYRRMSPEAATRLQSYEAVRRHHFPAGRARALFQAWRLALGYWSAVMRARLPLGQRIAAAAYVAHLTYWHATDLARDVRDALRSWLLRDTR